MSNNEVPWDDSNWRQEFKELKNLSKFQLEILENGPRSLSQSWILGAMHGEWRKMKGYKYPETPDCSSSSIYYLKHPSSKLVQGSWVRSQEYLVHTC